MDEGHVHVVVGVARMAGFLLQFLRGSFEPVDLVLLEPVVAAELALVG